MLRVLHITAWYPNEEDSLEGKFIEDRIRGLNQWCRNEVEHIRFSRGGMLWSRRSRNEGLLHQQLIRTRLPWRWIERIAAEKILDAWNTRKHDGVDLVVIHVAYPFAVQLKRIREIIPVPIIISEHWSAYHFNFFLQGLDSVPARVRRMFDHASGVICVSKALADDIRNFTGNPLPDSHVVGNPVNSSLFFFNPSVSREGFWAINRWTSVKNPFLLLESWRIVQELNPGLILNVVGDGPLIPEMKRFADDTGLSQVVIFHGPFGPPEVAKVMQRARCVISSSSYETFSISCAEALMCGTPVVCPPLASVREYGRKGEVIFSQTHCAESLADAVAEFLRNEPDISQGEIAMHARSLFAAEISNEQYFRVLTSYLDKS